MKTSPWPKPSPDALDSFFGKIELGEDGYPRESWENNFLQRILLPFPMRLAWEPDHRITRMRVHREVAKSLQRCLGAILDHFKTAEAVRDAGLDLFGGCYSYRRSAGTNNLSLHAYGAAIDFCLPTGKEISVEVVEIFEREGWAWGGNNKKRPEPGHFEAINRK